MWIVAPTYRIESMAGPAGRTTGIKRVTEMPLFETSLPEPPGIRLTFDDPALPQTVDVPIPRLPGMDEVEVDLIRAEVSSAEREETATAPGTPSGGSITLALSTAPAGAVVRLKRVEIEDLRIEAPTGAGQGFRLPAAGGGSAVGSVSFVRDADGSTRVETNVSTGADRPAHCLLRPAAGAGFGPPAAAAPPFPMPGGGGAMYGPALGAATLTLSRDADGRIKAVLRPVPALVGSRFALVLGSTGGDENRPDLPNEVVANAWSAGSVRAVFDVRPASLKVEATTASLPDEHPTVAEFPTDPGDLPVAVDFAPVARSLLRKAYPLAAGDDLGLKLRLMSGSPGVVRVHLKTTRARYLHRPLADGPMALALQGAPESVDLTIPAGLRPAAFSFVVDGVFGPGRLTLDSDTAPPDRRHGMRVAGGVRVARAVTLTEAEAALPLLRVAVFGRASQDCEVLLTLHAGDELRVGRPLTEAVSLELKPEAVPRWHRFTWSGSGLLPPHRSRCWLVARATRGVFWWHGPLDENGSIQRSDDDGETFVPAGGRPFVQWAVREEDVPTGFPAPWKPVELSWADGLLNGDLVGVDADGPPQPPDFRRFWIAEGAGHAAFLDRIAGLEGRLRLTFASPRDVAVNLSEVTLAYDPWSARGAGA